MISWTIFDDRSTISKLELSAERMKIYASFLRLSHHLLNDAPPQRSTAFHTFHTSAQNSTFPRGFLHEMGCNAACRKAADMV